MKDGPVLARSSAITEATKADGIPTLEMLLDSSLGEEHLPREVTESR